MRGGISEYNLYLSRTLVSSVDMTAKIEVVFCCVYVNYFWQVYSASIPGLQENYCLTKMQHTLTLASLLKHTALGPEQSNFSQWWKQNNALNFRVEPLQGKCLQGFQGRTFKAPWFVFIQDANLKSIMILEELLTGTTWLLEHMNKMTFLGNFP